MKKCSRSIARSTTWSKLAAAAVACCVATSRVASWGVGGVCTGAAWSGVVWANEVWTNRDAAQQTRESVKSANGERNIFVCFIRNFLLGFQDRTIVNAPGSRQCETIFIGNTPDGLPSTPAQPKIAPFVAYFCNTSPSPNPLWTNSAADLTAIHLSRP